jgi:hypothetical protein
MKKSVREARALRLKGMHHEVMNMNDENLYFRWIMLVPDEPAESDFLEIAEDNEEYRDAIELYEELKAMDKEGR